MTDCSSSTSRFLAWRVINTPTHGDEAFSRLLVFCRELAVLGLYCLRRSSENGEHQVRWLLLQALFMTAGVLPVPSKTTVRKKELRPRASQFARRYGGRRGQPALAFVKRYTFLREAERSRGRVVLQICDHGDHYARLDHNLRSAKRRAAIFGGYLHT
jgi:hypothetical protein